MQCAICLNMLFSQHMKNTVVKFLLSSLLVFTLITALFYFLVLKPKLALPGKLISVEKVVSINHFNLVQNRLSILGLANLDSNSPNLAGQNTALIEKALETNLKGLENLQNPPLVRKLEKESSINTNDLFNLNKSILEEQQVHLLELKRLSVINRNIFKYKPLTDLGTLDLQSEIERERVIERSYNAIEGLEKVVSKLERSDKSKEAENLIVGILDTQNLIKEQISYLEGGDYTAASLSFLKVVKNFETLRESGLELERAVLYSTASVNTLTKQTNLMLKYEHILEKINDLQKSLPETNLYSLF